MKHIIVVILVLCVIYLKAQSCSIANNRYRTISGRCNNLNNPLWGAANTALSRDLPARFQDGFSQQVPGPHPRTVSRRLLNDPVYIKNDPLFTEAERITGTHQNIHRLNMLAVGFVQFVDHDLTELDLRFDVRNILANFDMVLPSDNDPLFEAVPPPGYTNVTSVARNYPRRLLLKFVLFPTTVNNVTQGVNRITSYLDLSQTYGSDDVTAFRLRSGIDGKMRLVNGLIPKSTLTGVRSQCGDFGGDAFGAGDSRADTTQTLVDLHHFFVYEHNRLCDKIKSENPSYDDETLYQEARRINIAQYQHIFFSEFLPILLGPEIVNLHIGNYNGYNAQVDASLSHEFAITASRVVGHSIVNLPQLNLLDANCTHVIGPGTDDGYANLNDLENYYGERISCAYDFTLRMGIGISTRGAMIQFARDPRAQGVVFSMDNIKSKGSTPASLGIVTNDVLRQRQLGIPSFTQMLNHYSNVNAYDAAGCQEETVDSVTRDSLACFQALTANTTLAQEMQALYGRISAVDANAGMFNERLRTSTGVSRTAAIIFAKEMKKLRDGDRFFYLNQDAYSQDEIRAIKMVKMSDIIKRHAGLGNNIPEDVFRVVPKQRLCPN